MRRLWFCALVAATLSAAAAEPTRTEITDAIRGNDLPRLKQLIQSRDAANVSNGIGATPLHYAAIYGSLEAMGFLLKAGADPNARDQSGATPLVYAAWSYERMRLLVEHNADVNVATKHGITPVLVASGVHGNVRTVRYLLDKGADLNARSDEHEDALMRAAYFGDPETVRLLLEHGADAKHADKSGLTALMLATAYPDSARVRMLLKAGSDPNAVNTFGGMVKNGPIALTHLSPLMLAAPYSDQETIVSLLKAGARVNETDSRKMTPLMLAVGTDYAQPTTVRLLLAAGADVQPKDIYGESVLDWARKYNNPEILSMLTAARARGADTSAAAVPVAFQNAGPADCIKHSLVLFGKSDFFPAGGGCAGCHHQPAHARAFAAAKSANLSPDPALRQAFVDSVVANRPRFMAVLPTLSTFGGDFDVVLQLMAAEADLKEPSSALTDLMAHFVAARQDASGAWVHLGTSRAPLEESTISRTAYAITCLKQYSWPARQAEFDERVERAAAWLAQASPKTTYEHADRIAGLYTAGLAASKLRSDADRLVSLQHEDGGWAQTKHLESDAYATGTVLDTLFRAGLLKQDDPAYKRGVSFLLRTQFPDGSWHVRSRAPKFQPYFQSGFPFDHDQWISSVGTAWAVMALSHAAAPSLSASAVRP